MTPETAPLSHSLYLADFTKTIWLSHKDTFIKKMKHLNRILSKHGKPPITYTFSEPRAVPVTFEYHLKGDAYRNDEIETRLVEVVDVHCKGLTTVKKDDVEYTYLGTVSFEDGVKQVFCNNEAYANYFMDDFRPNFCDHCHTTRTNRKAYYLFRNTRTNQILQIGSTCAKEYFGIDSAAFLQTYGNTFITLSDGSEEELGGFKDNSLCYGLSTLIPVVSLCTNGFLKWNKKDAYHTSSCCTAGVLDLSLQDLPTTEAVESVLTSWDTLHPIHSSEGDRNNAALLSPEEIVSFWDSKFSKERSSFAYNCLQAVQAGYTTHRSLGAFCYAIFAAYNAKVKTLRDSELAKSLTIVPCAYPVNSRQTLQGVITNIRTIQDEACYDGYHYVSVTKYIVDFTDSNGTFYHFTTSSETFSRLHNNDRISLRATIGETKPFKSVPYTHLSRPSATILPPPSASSPDSIQKQSA